MPLIDQQAGRNKSMSCYCAFLLFFVVLAGASVEGYSQDKVELSEMDTEIAAGLKSTSEGKWSDGRKHFEKALTLHEKSGEASRLIFLKIDVPDEGGEPSKNEVEGQILRWRHSMATHQGLRQFVAYCYLLDGDQESADKAIEEVYGVQNVMWGLSWRVFVPLMDDLFRSVLPKTGISNYGKFLFDSGKLVLSAGHEKGLDSILAAYREDSKNPEISAELASIYIVRLEPELVRKYAAASLAAEPKQGRLLIDLATADWLLGDLEAAGLHARQASELEPRLPGPHATLALAAIEKGEPEAALKESETGVELSGEHVFYVTIHAIALEASGKPMEAEKLIRKGWGEDLPDEARLRKWFFRGKPLTMLLGIIERVR